MPLPFFLFALWALWPLAAYPGGKLFAPLVFVMGLFALGSVWRRPLGREAVVILAMLAWICLTAFWSPTDGELFSGSLLEENFALEAAHLRFVLTMLGCVLFVRLLQQGEPAEVRRAMPWVCGGIGVHLVIVGVVAVAEGPLMASQGGFLVPTVHSMGRNANFLAMAVPVLIGALFVRGNRATAWIGTVALLTATLVFAFMLDGMAVLLAAVLGLLAIGVLFVFQRGGFRALFNLTAFGVMFAPALAWLQNSILPARAINLPLSTEQRFMIWQATLEKIAEKPLFGHGINAASTWAETYNARPDLLAPLSPELINHRVIPSHPHNMSLQIWAETGLVGAALAALVLIFIGRALPPPLNVSGSVKIAAGGLFGAALTYFAVSYSVWDESFWASIAVVFSGIVVLARYSDAA